MIGRAEQGSLKILGSALRLLPYAHSTAWGRPGPDRSFDRIQPITRAYFSAPRQFLPSKRPDTMPAASTASRVASTPSTPRISPAGAM